MISAQTETQQQERLIENYMSLPNQVWDGIILQATQVSGFSPAVMCVVYLYINLIFVALTVISIVGLD